MCVSECAECVPKTSTRSAASLRRTVDPKSLGRTMDATSLGRTSCPGRPWGPWLPRALGERKISGGPWIREAPGGLWLAPLGKYKCIHRCFRALGAYPLGRPNRLRALLAEWSTRADLKRTCTRAPRFVTSGTAFGSVDACRRRWAVSVVGNGRQALHTPTYRVNIRTYLFICMHLRNINLHMYK